MRVNHRLWHKNFQTSVNWKPKKKKRNKMYVIRRRTCQKVYTVCRGSAHSNEPNETLTNSDAKQRLHFKRRRLRLCVFVFFFLLFDETRISFACTFSMAPISSFQDRLKHPHTNAMKITTKIFDFRINLPECRIRLHIAWFSIAK